MINTIENVRFELVSIDYKTLVANGNYKVTLEYKYF